MKVNGWDNATSSSGLHCVSIGGASGMETRNGGGKRRLQFRCRSTKDCGVLPESDEQCGSCKCVLKEALLHFMETLC